jgi:hypothetical protein
MPNTYVDVIKKNVVINVSFTLADVTALQTILLKHLEHKITLDDKSWNIIEDLCTKVDQCAKDQNLTESKEISF